MCVRCSQRTNASGVRFRPVSADQRWREERGGAWEKPTCRGCGESLNSENDSEAHVIPNALGGRLKPKGIICRTCNTELDDAADNALVAAFGAWPTLLDIPRDRGANPPKVTGTRGGSRVRLQPDGSSRAIDVKYEVRPV